MLNQSQLLEPRYSVAVAPVKGKPDWNEYHIRPSGSSGWVPFGCQNEPSVAFAGKDGKPESRLNIQA